MKTREEILAEFKQKFPKTTDAAGVYKPTETAGVSKTAVIVKASLEDVVQAIVVHAANSGESAEINVPTAISGSTLGDWVKTHAPILTTKAEFVKQFNSVQLSEPEIEAFIHDLQHIVFIVDSLVSILKKGQSC